MSSYRKIYFYGLISSNVGNEVIVVQGDMKKVCVFAEGRGCMMHTPYFLTILLSSVFFAWSRGEQRILLCRKKYYEMLYQFLTFVAGGSGNIS